MSSVFRKLNLTGQRTIVVIGAPDSFETELATLDDVTVLRRADDGETIDFALVFAISQADVDAGASAVAARAPGDAIVWFAYPKGSSKRYRCEFNRDTGWATLGSLGFEPVRQVAVDDDWSALRFRRVEHIAKMTRKTSLTREGAAKSAAGRAKGSGRNP